MEDRYLFKAKRLDNGEWEIGSLIILPNGECEIWNRCNNPPDSDPMWRRCVITHKVEPDTICQCTGLKDENGNLIWENDVVRVYGDTDDFGNDLYFFYKVVWNKDLCCWWLSDIYTQEDEYLYICLKGIDVIGNIFDNKELLESEERL